MVLLRAAAELSAGSLMLAASSCASAAVQSAMQDLSSNSNMTI